MQALEQLSREELIALVHDLQARPSTRRDEVDSSGTDLDYVAGQALSILDNSGIAALIFDTSAELRVLAANACLSALAGYPPDQAPTLTVSDLLAVEDRPRLRRMLRLPRQGGLAGAGTWRLLTRFGEVREIEVSGYDLDYHGRRARFAIAQVATARRREQLMQQRLAAIVETSRDAIVSRTIEGIVLSWNRAAERLFGYGAAEIVGRSIDVLLPPEIRTHEREFLRGRIEAGLPLDSYYTQRQHKDGTLIDVAISVAPLKDVEGRIVGASSIVRDVRAMKEAQRKLAESHERLRRLAELSYDWCWEQDENLRFTYHSAERDGTPDLVRHSVLGRTRLELPIVWQSERQKEDHAAALARHQPFKDLEYRVADAQGQERFMTVSGEPIFDSTGRFLGYRGIGRDITERRGKEDSLKLLSAVVGSTDEAIMSWRSDGTLLTWNAGAKAMLGYSPEEAIGKPVALLFPAAAGADEPCSHALAGEHVVNAETALRHKNGTIIQVAVTCSPILDEQGAVSAVACIARDVRQHKLQERLVSESYQRLRLALESAALSLWDWDIPARNVIYSDEFARMLGFTPGELPRESQLCEQLVHPEDASALHGALARVLRGEEDLLACEFRVRNRADQWRWLSVRGRLALRDRDGAALRLTGTAQDVTERRRDSSLDQLLAAVLESPAEVVFTHSLDGLVLGWNRGAERALGWLAPEILGRDCRTLIPEDRRDEAERIAAIARAGHAISRVETVRLHKDGHQAYLSLTLTPLREPDGRVVGVAAIGRDITDQRRAEDALRESEARFRSLIEASAQAVWVTNADGDVESEIPSWQRYTGSSFEQVRDQGWLRAVHPDDRPGAARAWLQARRTASVYEAELRVRRHDGVWRHLQVRSVPVRNQDGSVREWVGMNTDITERKEAEAARALLASVAESSQDAIVSYDMEGTILSCNRGVEEIFGYRADQLVGHDCRVLWPGSTSDHRRTLVQRLAQGERIAPLEIAGRHHDGSEVPVSVSVAALRDERGDMVGVTAVARDISEPRRAAERLRESEQQLESILNNAAEALIVVSADGAIERFNLAAQRLFGYSADEVRALNLRQLTVELTYDQAAELQEERQSAWLRPLIGGRREVTGRRKDGSIFPLELSLSEIGIAPRPPRFTAVVRDITDRKSWENRIYTLAYSDSLTGLPNRLLLRDRLEHAIAAAQRNRSLVGVLFFDLDHFKVINDSYGHHVGDELLRDIAARATGCIREIDTVCRLGGDEFVLVLPELHDSGDAGAVARKLLAVLSQPYCVDGHELRITPTLGISIYPKDGDDADTLVRNADTAMYHAKEGGKNSFRYFNPEGERWDE